MYPASQCSNHLFIPRAPQAQRGNPEGLRRGEGEGRAERRWDEGSAAFVLHRNVSLRSRYTESVIAERRGWELEREDDSPGANDVV